MSGEPERIEPTLPSIDGPIYPPPRNATPAAKPAPVATRPAPLVSANPRPPAGADREAQASADPARTPRAQGVAVAASAQPKTPPAPPVFVSDAAAQPDTLGRAAPLARLSELIAHRGARGPLSIALLGGPGSGKTHALADVVEGANLLSTAALSASASPFLPRLVALKLDAADLGEEPEATIAERLHARLSREYPQIARRATEEATHASADPRQTARLLADSLDQARKRLNAERVARDDAANRRARLTETVLYETPGSQIDAYARANRGRTETSLRAFGFNAADSIVEYKSLVHSFAESGGAGNRVLAGLRSLWAYRGQKKLIVLAVIFFLFSLGFGRLAGERDWLTSIDSVDSLRALAAWLSSHMSWFATVSRLLEFASLFSLALLVWRAWRFTHPLWRGAQLLDYDIAARKADLERQIAHHAQRVDVLTREADALAERAAEAEKRAGGPERGVHVAPAFMRDGPSRVGQARAYLSALDALASGDAAESGGPAPTRYAIAIDSFDHLSPDRGLATMAAAAAALAKPAFALVTAFDPRHFDGVAGAAATIQRIVQTPFTLAASDAPGWTAFVEQLAGRAQAAHRAPRAPANGSTLDTPLAEPETKLLAALAQLAGPSPRGVNRLVNLYRLARRDAPDDLAALAFMLALNIGGSDAEKMAVARGLSSVDSFAAFSAPDGGPRIAAGFAAAAIAQGGPVTNASARRASVVARMWSI
ncbi:MAG: hypothetical protein KGM42_04860 [Hyphomicrobiales bacterium]|nr:hypothetical protein [Hyphomicrobiales bacterium]